VRRKLYAILLGAEAEKRLGKAGQKLALKEERRQQLASAEEASGAEERLDSGSEKGEPKEGEGHAPENDESHSVQATSRRRKRRKPKRSHITILGTLCSLSEADDRRSLISVCLFVK
jgi:hypothetical protein